MAMKTQVRNTGGKTVISIEGKLDFESSDTFRQWLLGFSRTATSGPVVFDLGALQFVGSSGITQFIESLKDYNRRATIKPVYSNVSSEFRRMMAVYDDSGSFQFWDTLASPLLDN
ncbi:MAG TPA: STAS domain-containing protein [Oligoflexia bacterium]|nr:STAS domain-containing protein [Oligoflexia bacterium]